MDVLPVRLPRVLLKEAISVTLCGPDGMKKMLLSYSKKVFNKSVHLTLIVGKGSARKPLLVVTAHSFKYDSRILRL
jgi:hypothetical protein